MCVHFWFFVSLCKNRMLLGMASTAKEKPTSCWWEKTRFRTISDVEMYNSGVHGTFTAED